MNIIKEAIDDPSPTTLEGENPAKRMSKKLEEMAAQMAAKKKDEVQFSDKLSLADNYKTTYGVKFDYEGKTYEEKKRVVTTKELKKTLSQRKLSKEEFKLLQNQNGNNR